VVRERRGIEQRHAHLSVSRGIFYFGG